MKNKNTILLALIALGAIVTAKASNQCPTGPTLSQSEVQNKLAEAPVGSHLVAASIPQFDKTSGTCDALAIGAYTKTATSERSTIKLGQWIYAPRLSVSGIWKERRSMMNNPPDIEGSHIPDIEDYNTPAEDYNTPADIFVYNNMAFTLYTPLTKNK